MENKNRKYNLGKYELLTIDYSDSEIDEIIELLNYGGDMETGSSSEGISWYGFFRDFHFENKEESKFYKYNTCKF